MYVCHIKVVHAYGQIYVYALIRSSHEPIWASMYLYARTYTYTHIYVHITYTYTHIYTYMNVQRHKYIVIERAHT